jgi:AraC-like DNA-binding protein
VRGLLRGRRLGDLHRGRLGNLRATEPPVVFIRVVLPGVEAPIRRGFALSHITMLTARSTISHVTSRPDEAQRLRDLKLLRRVRDRMDREYAQPLDVEALARGVNMSAGHLSRQFRLAYGESPYSYLMTRRIERAMALLRRGDLSVTEVCFAVGCASLGTFSTRFTELVGMPPSAYREQTAGMTEGIPSCVEKQVTRPIRNREAPIAELHLA